MAFEGLGEKLQETFKKLRGKGKLGEKDIKEAMREVKLALLEADVNFKVVKKFVKNVSEKCVGSEVLESLTPAQQVIKIVNDELTTLMGGSKSEIDFSGVGPTVIMMAGLQGAGKTTMTGKLALQLRKNYNKRPLLVACDIYRPAAIEQLKTIGKELNIPVYEEGIKNPNEIVRNALEYAKENKLDYILIDTAGRLHVDEELMNELKSLNEEFNPDEILLVLDSMIGQDAINVINGFNDKLPLTGTILTKLDGDTKGGVALSARHLTNVPIKFIGTSEKLDGLEVFDPERMVNRILGMGDIMSLVEKVESVYTEEDEKNAEKTFKKMQKGKFDLEDFLAQFKQIKKLGSIEGLLKLIPGAKKMGLNNINIDPKDMARVEAIILSMTPEERRKPEIIKANRKIRIAKGSGTSVQEVNKLLTQFEQSKKMMKMFSNGSFKMPF